MEKKITKFQRYQEALIKISQIGSGVPKESIDWRAVGQSAIYFAQEALKEKCPRCGTPQHFHAASGKGEE